jgi:hypothetical protein
MSDTEPVPRILCRVQHGGSFTYHDRTEGFVANGQYFMDYSHWINPAKVSKHLDWKDISEEPTPFISLFSNRRKIIFTSPIRPHTLTDRHDRGCTQASGTVPTATPSKRLCSAGRYNRDRAVQPSYWISRRPNRTIWSYTPCDKYDAVSNARHWTKVLYRLHSSSEVGMARTYIHSTRINHLFASLRYI